MLDRKPCEAIQIKLRHRLSQIGATTFFLTHDQEEALTMSDGVADMHHARIDPLADPHTLYPQSPTAFVRSFIDQSLCRRGDKSSRQIDR
ncbi:hypothetical protein [Rhizobium sp. FY34]|uniref:hypothetical protein n=1 Tax=Rhizobium sp. FY34 TaxID=2562309 RepID=UPI0010C02764|nr:hypothetical protein [Rhizobium sp. FY34]